MRTNSMMPVILFLLVTALLCAPGIDIPPDDSEARGGLICYCCSTTCSGCMVTAPCTCNHKAVAGIAAWSSDMLPGSFTMTIVFWPLQGWTESFPPPKLVYLNPPVKPPKKL